MPRSNVAAALPRQSLALPLLNRSAPELLPSEIVPPNPAMFPLKVNRPRLLMVTEPFPLHAPLDTLVRFTTRVAPSPGMLTALVKVKALSSSSVLPLARVIPP